MNIDSTTLFDLLRISIHRNDERIKRLADSLFMIYANNMSKVSSSDIKYCELMIALSKEVIGKQLNITDSRIDIANTFKRHLMNPIYLRDTYIKELLDSALEAELSPSRIADITLRLNNLVTWYVSKDYINKLYGHMKEGGLQYAVDDQNDSLNCVKSLIEEFRTKITEVEMSTGKHGPIEVIDMKSRDSIDAAYRLFKERRVNHVLKTGLQGLNQMFGPLGGIALGESVLFAARTHHYKSGMLMKMASWIATYSTPPKIQGKKPMILFISLENEGYQNMLSMFKSLYIACYNEKPPVGMSDEAMVDAIYDLFSKSPYTLVIERYLPSVFGYEELVNLVEKYENSGFNVVVTIIDYISQMKTHNYGSSSSAGEHSLLQDLFNRVCNYFKAVGTSIISATQLNRGASDIAASGVPLRVRYYSERHFAGSTGIAREVDFLAYMEIEKDQQGKPWLTISWGKHRYEDNTPELHKIACYKFDEDKGILDDIDGPSMCVRDIYATKKETKTASPADIESILGMT